ncbi:MAG TPA: hypothetical protein VJR05_14780 [Acidimicrobiia bacterium]|nr:hypothetical protein [Acidimicrobiia bacterium]
MSGPIVYISRWRIKEGVEHEWWSMVERVLPGLEAAKPRTVFQNFYVDESGNLSILHIFPDAEAMDLHAEGAMGRSQTAYEFIEPIGFEIYGSPTESFLATLRDIPNIDSLLQVWPDHRAGFSRF